MLIRSDGVLRVNNEQSHTLNTQDIGQRRMYKEKSQLSLKYKQRKVEIMRNFLKIHNNEKLSDKVKKHNEQEEIEMIHKDGYSGQKQV